VLGLFGPEGQSTHTFGGAEIYKSDGFGQNRAKLWRDIPDKSAAFWVRPALSSEQADALFNYCHMTIGPRKTPLPTH